MACLAAKPIVDGIEAQYVDRLVVLRVDVQDPAGKELTRELRALGTPTFIFFTAEGDELWHSVGALDAEKVAQSLK